MVAFAAGAKTTFTDSADHILDLKKGLDFLDSGNLEIALLKRLGTNGFEAKSYKHEWTEVALATRSETVTLADGSGISLTVADAYQYQVGELIKIESEVVRVTAIAGATSQTYTATANGDYAVVVTNASGCSDTSSCVTIDYISLTEIIDASIQVYPNPTSGEVFVTMSATEAKVDVIDAQGKVLQVTTVSNGEKVSLAAYETGVYFLRIVTENGSTLARIVKQ